MVLSFVYYGNPILRQKCSKIEEITPEIKAFAKDLTEALHAKKGAAIAAPQVGRSIRMFILGYTGTDENGNPVFGEPEVVINPKILSYSQETWIHDEGCLSIPGVWGEVERPTHIKVEYLNLDGKKIEEEISMWKARAFLHENDHLNGVLHIDRYVSKKMRKKANDQLQKIKKKYKS